MAINQLCSHEVGAFCQKESATLACVRGRVVCQSSTELVFECSKHQGNVPAMYRMPDHRPGTKRAELN